MLAGLRKSYWGVAVAVFVGLLVATWFFLKNRFNADIPPTTYGFVAKFESEGIPRFKAPAFKVRGHATDDVSGAAKPAGSSGPGGGESGVHQAEADTVFDISELKEPIVIVNFWASWCNPCVQEFPSMLKLVEQMNGKVAIVAVSMDEDVADIRTFLKLFGVPRAGFHVIWDKDKSVGGLFGVSKLPESFIVGRDRKLIRKVLGIEDWSSPNAISYFESLSSQP